MVSKRVTVWEYCCPIVRSLLLLFGLRLWPAESWFNLNVPRTATGKALRRILSEEEIAKAKKGE